MSLVAGLLIELLKHRKKEYGLTYSLGDSRRYKLKEGGNITISVKYKGIEMHSPLSVIPIDIVNTGRKDITFNERFHSKLVINHPSYRFIDVNVLNPEEKSAPIAELDGEGLPSISWDILKPNEVVKIELVAEEIKPIVNIEDLEAFTFNFRALDINDVSIKRRPILRKNMAWFARIVCLFTFTAYIGLGFFKLSSEHTRSNVYYEGVCYKNSYVVFNRYTHTYSIKDSRGHTVVPECIAKYVCIRDVRVDNESNKVGPDSLSLFISAFLFLLLYLYADFGLPKTLRRRRIRSR